MDHSKVERRSPYATDAAIRRKNNKPLMEKRRRERINRCLNELQALLLENSKPEHSHSKLEKADILEMTVKHIKQLRRRAATSAGATGGADCDGVMKYRAGYSECMGRLSQCVTSLALDEQTKFTVLKHFSAHLQPAAIGQTTSAAQRAPQLTIQIPTPPSSPSSPPLPIQGNLVPLQGGMALLIPGGAQLTTVPQSKPLAPLCPKPAGGFNMTAALNMSTGQAFLTPTSLKLMQERQASNEPMWRPWDH